MMDVAICHLYGLLIQPPLYFYSITTFSMLDMIHQLWNTINKDDTDILDLKKEIAEDIIQKFKDENTELLLWIGDDLIKDYLIDEGILDRIKDFAIEQWINLLNHSLLLKWYREQLSKLSTRQELEAFQKTLTTSSTPPIDTTDRDTIQQHILHPDQSPLHSSSESDQQHTATTAHNTTHQTPTINTGGKDNNKAELPTTKHKTFFEKYEHLQWAEKPDFQPFMYALQWYEAKKSSLWNTRYLTIVDYSKPNTENRFFVIDMNTNTVVHAVPVGHGKKSWGTYATSFSNEEGSNQSSLWFFTTPQKITKAHSKKWRWLLMKGLENSNDKATNRGIYIHPGSVKGSEGCFTLPKDSDEILQKLQWESLLFSYYPDNTYLASSQLLTTWNSSTTAMAA